MRFYLRSGLLLAGVYTTSVLCEVAQLGGRNDYAVDGSPDNTHVYVIPPGGGAPNRILTIQKIGNDALKMSSHFPADHTARDPLSLGDISYEVWSEHWRLMLSKPRLVQVARSVLDQDPVTAAAIERAKTLHPPSQSFTWRKPSPPDGPDHIPRREDEAWSTLKKTAFTRAAARLAWVSQQEILQIEYDDEGLTYTLATPPRNVASGTSAGRSGSEDDR